MSESGPQHVEHLEPGHREHDGLHRLMRAADPLRGRAPTLLAVTAAELRDRAAHRRRHRRIAATCVLAALGTAAALAATIVHLGPPAGRQAPAGPPADPVPLQVPHPDSGPPARQRLDELSARAAAGTDTDPHTGIGAGVTTRITYRTWDPANGEQSVRVLWRPDLSAAETRDPLPARTFGPGQYPVAVADPATRPEILAGQLAHHMQQTQAANLAQAVADMNRFHCLTSGQRAAALRVLADTGDVTLHGDVTDRHGRTGVAVSMNDPAGVRHLLVFDPGTGVLLSYEQVTQIGPATSPVRTPALLSYVVYLACEQTPD